jgi:formamidopyrimidine-DNA glycosylase
MVRGITVAALKKRLEGGKFTATARHGKILFLKLDRGFWLLLHFGMTGSLDYAADTGRAPPYTRLLVRFAKGRRLAFIDPRGLGRIGLVDDPVAFVARERLGPDALSPGVGLAEFRHLLAERRGAIKPALMDQRFIAGIGNIYSDEILFQARLDPRAEARALGDAATARLHGALRRVLQTAIERKAEPERMPRSWLLPIRGKGGSCPACGGPLRQSASGGRHGYYCPACQRGR